MNGLEATRLIKESKTGAETKIVALTAHALEEERLEILESGCDDFIRKPYRDTEIFDAMAKQLGVQFQYAGEAIPAVVIKEDTLDYEKLKKLPPDLIENLREAAILLDDQLCLKVAGMISDYDNELGMQLCCMTEDFNYKEILEAIDNLRGLNQNE